MLDTNEIRMFVDIVRTGSFAAAARRLGIPANTLSRRVRRLELSLHARLMHRSTRSLSLTAAGQTFYNRCAPSIVGLLNASQELIAGSQLPAGPVRVAAPAGFLDLLPMTAIVEFLGSHPKICLELLLDDAMSDLIRDRIDIAFRAGPLRTANFTSRKIIAHRFGLVAGPNYLRARGFPTTLQQLAEHDCLTITSSESRTIWQLKGPHGLESVEVTGAFRCNEARSLLAACVQGLGVALLPESLTAAFVADGRLSAVLPLYKRDSGGFHVVLPSRQQVPAAVAAFAAFAETRLRALIPEFAKGRGSKST
jgi:DNA-binding transcriptional LysR family regulator